MYFPRELLMSFTNKDKELEGGGGTKIYVLVLPVGGGGGGFENFTCLKRGATKKYYNCRVSPLSLPLYSK